MVQCNCWPDHFLYFLCGGLSVAVKFIVGEKMEVFDADIKKDEGGRLTVIELPFLQGRFSKGRRERFM